MYLSLFYPASVSLLHKLYTRPTQLQFGSYSITNASVYAIFGLNICICGTSQAAPNTFKFDSTRHDWLSNSELLPLFLFRIQEKPGISKLKSRLNRSPDKPREMSECMESFSLAPLFCHFSCLREILQSYRQISAK